jgi:hypothetical protein
MPNRLRKEGTLKNTFIAAATLTQMATKLSDLQVLIETSNPPSEA